MRRGVSLAALTAGLIVLGGCSSATPPAATLPGPTASATPAPSDFAPLMPSGTPTTLAEGLDAPWSIARLGDSTLISERDSGRVLELGSDGAVRVVGVVPGVSAQGEGGLLGLATHNPGDGQVWLYAYLTTASDNRIVRMPLTGRAGSLGLGAPETVLAGLDKAGNHNGGRIAFGPDGMLYATVGDAGVPERAQDLGSLGGKILRMTPTGAVPADNPDPNSLIYTLGHRNPQGLAWAADGTMYASEFGQNTWDELNVIVAGHNYGWPTVEGIGNTPGYTDPIHQWATSEASPSGLTMIDGTLFMAALRGQRLWSIQPTTEGVTATDWFVGEYGRLRDVAAGPDGTLWVLTNNTDGRGDPHAGDDRLLQVRLTEPKQG